MENTGQTQNNPVPEHNKSDTQMSCPSITQLNAIAEITERLRRNFNRNELTDSERELNLWLTMQNVQQPEVKRLKLRRKQLQNNNGSTN